VCLVLSICDNSPSVQQVDGSAPVGKEFMTTPASITTETISTTTVSEAQEASLSDLSLTSKATK
jgi:hypothetical protein